MRYLILTVFLAWRLALPLAWAEGLPTDAEMEAAARKAALLMAAPELQPGKVVTERHIGDLPSVAPLPGGVLDKLFTRLRQPLAPAADGMPALLVLVSFSMPPEALRNLARQADSAGAVLVLRGLVEDSLDKTARAIRAVLGDDAGDSTFQINPNAFRAYQVQDVPTFILAQTPADGEASCTAGTDYVSVRGDATLEYALRKLGANTGWQAAAAHYLQAMGVKP